MPRIEKRQEQEDDTSSEDSSDQVAVQIEDEESEGGAEDAKEETAEEEEAEEEEKDPPPPPPKKKRTKIPCWVWVVAAAVILAILAGIGGGVYYAVAVAGKTATNATTNGTTAGTNSTATGIIRPTTTPLNCPLGGRRWIKDVMLPVVNNQKWQVNIYNVGLVEFDEMRDICDRLNRISGVRDDELTALNLLYLNNKAGEKERENAIKDNSAYVFDGLTSDQRLLWTGMLYSKSSNGNWVNTFPWLEAGYQNFCNNQWSAELTRLQQSGTDRVYIVKDFRGNKIDKNQEACWQLYTRAQLLGLMGQLPNASPKLPFVCASENTGASGRVAMPGFFEPKRTEARAPGGPYFYTYGVKATYSAAVEECESYGGRLVSVNSVARYNELVTFLRNNDIRPTLTAKGVPLPCSWTGAYQDLTQPPSNRPIQMINNQPIDGVDFWSTTGRCAVDRTQPTPAINATIREMETRPDSEKPTRNRVVICRASDGGYCWASAVNPEINNRGFDPLFQQPRFYVLCEKN